MRRQQLLPILTFLAGLAVGSFAAGGYGDRSEPTVESGERDVTAVADDPSAAESTATPAQEPPRAGVLSAADEAPAPAAQEEPESTTDFGAKLRIMDAARARLQDDLARLSERVEGLERRLVASTQSPEAARASADRPSRPTTPEDRRSALVAAGLGEDRAADLVWRQGQQELDRLDLRDIAVREGWFGTDRYRDELEQIREDSIDMRQEIGEDIYDRYLFATGADNRVAIDSIIPGSTAEEAGLQPGDLIESYGDIRIFRFDDLRTATSEGERGELIPVRIRRGDGIVDAWLPRGPLGVRMDRAIVDPDA
jgi:hypothetical protein